MNRIIGSHALNRNSSRSHCVFTVHIEVEVKLPFMIYYIVYCGQTCLFLHTILSSRLCLSHSQSRSRTLSDSKYITSKLNLVDLAGSERLRKTGVSFSVCQPVCLVIFQVAFEFLILLSKWKKAFCIICQIT